MRCPKCKGAMEAVSHGEIELERCVVCRGLWFDMLEREDLAKLAGSEAVDVGGDAAGKNLDDVEEYPCPKCQAVMVRMVDIRQRHIWYEACSRCCGVFLDAGEFKDLKEDTWLDRLKSLRAKPRH